MFKLLFNLIKKTVLSFLVIFFFITLVNFATVSLIYNTNVISTLHRVYSEKNYLCLESLFNVAVLLFLVSVNIVIKLMIIFYKEYARVKFVDFDCDNKYLNLKKVFKRVIKDEKIIQLRI